MIYSTDKFPTKIGYWYIINMQNLLRIKLYPVYFINKVSAKRAINNHIARRNRDKYSIVSGKKLKGYSLKYQINLGPLHKFTKYEYPRPTNEMTRQEKKNIRTLFRRKLRRMGLLVHRKHKRNIKESKVRIRIIKNHQEVANCPNTQAVVFRLERLPKHYHYILLKKVKHPGKDILWKCRCIRFNSKTGEYGKLFINIYNKDVVIPQLISEIYQIANEKGNYTALSNYCRSKGIGVYKEKQKKVLPGVV